MRKHSQALAAFLATSLLIGFGSGCASVTHVSKWVSGQALVDATRDVAVEIRITGPSGQGGFGSGVVVDRRGLVITNNHVASHGANGMTIFVCTEANTSNAKCDKAKVIASSPQVDLALLQVERLFPATAPIGPSRALDEGEEVFTRASIGDLIGSALVYGRYVGRAKTGGVAKLDQPYLVVDIAGNHAGSGGPIFDRKRGELIGIMTSVVSFGGRPMTLAIPVATVVEFLMENDPYLKPVSR